MSDIESRFNAAMRSIYDRAKSEAGYNPIRFLQMLNEHGGLETAHILLRADGVPEGYTALWERGRLDLTMEAMILENEEWHQLFSSDEIEVARRRLKKYEYSIRK